MGLFKREEENFDDSAAFESDKGSMIKIFFMVSIVIIIIIIIIVIGYNQYQQWSNLSNETLLNETNISDSEENIDEKIIINFTDFNLTVDKNPEGLYYYTTREKVTGENCYIDGKRKSCKDLTNSVCAKKECIKDLITVTECFVNNKKITCPDDIS